MHSPKFSVVLCMLFVGCLADLAPLSGADQLPDNAPQVTAPPDAYFEKIRERDRSAAREFYKKFIDIRGVACMAGEAVDDAALRRVYEIVTHMLAGRPDISRAMADNGTRLIIIGKDQVYTDMPEYRDHPNPAFQNERVRGTGGLDVTSFGEENLLNLALDRYDDESIAVHEFCHTIDAALRRIEPEWKGRLSSVYRHAVEQGRYRFAYAGANAGEYWAEICQCYFDCNRINNWNHSAVGTREQLKEYDPEGYELVRDTFKLTPNIDWRFTPVRMQPSVIAPPPQYMLDPFYTKFTWARELPVVGSSNVDDQALLRANDTIRKMFAYRHDLLKTLINDGGRVVVLARSEHVADLPEFRDASDQAFAMARYTDYSREKKFIVVPEESIVGGRGDAMAGKSLLIGQMAKAVYLVAGTRDVDERFPTVRRDSQQYEQRLLWDQPPQPIERMDVRFDLRLRELFAAAQEQGKWRGTPASQNNAEYWAAGVAAYFDAVGDGFPPVDAPRPITTREALKAYDPDLYDLVDKTLLFDGRQDWRFTKQ